MKLEPVGLGSLLGALDVLAIAFGIAATYAREELVAVALPIAAAGILPGLLTGAFLGSLAERLGARPVWLRLMVLFAPALLLIVFGPALLMLVGIARIGDMVEFAEFACVPTLVAVLVLERATRARLAQQIPPARVRQ